MKKKLFKIRVYYEDTDAGGIVYYANYLNFLERARTQMLFDNGFTHTSLKEDFKLFTVVKSCNIDFIKPAKLDDEIKISTSLHKKSRIQIYLNQNIYNNKSLIVKALVRIVTVNNKGKVTKMPLDLYNIF